MIKTKNINDISLTFLNTSIAFVIFIIAKQIIEKNNILSSVLLIMGGIYLFLSYYLFTKDILNSRGLFSLSWLLSIGLSCLRLHPFQVYWKEETWKCLYFAYIFLCIGFGLRKNFKINMLKIRKVKLLHKKYSTYGTILLMSIIIITALIIDIIGSGYVPILNRKINSYISFGVPRVHIITVCCILIPAYTIYYINNFSISKKRKYVLYAYNLIVSAIPVIIVSRQLLILEVAVIVFMEIEVARLKLRHIVYGIFFVVVGWYILSIFRNQNEQYLKYVFDIYDMKGLTINQWQAYLYVAFNYDNFNANVQQIDNFTHGAKALEPLISLTRTKFLFKEALEGVQWKMVLKTFNAYPFVIVGYNDFGTVGVVAYSFFIGYIGGIIENNRKKIKNVNNLFCHCVYNYAIIFTFFTSFFSNVLIWVYVIISFIWSRFILENERAIK